MRKSKIRDCFESVLANAANREHDASVAYQVFLIAREPAMVRQLLAVSGIGLLVCAGLPGCGSDQEKQNPRI
jgi:hypothetical protein